MSVPLQYDCYYDHTHVVYELVDWVQCAIKRSNDRLEIDDWTLMSYNPAAIHLLEANPDKINWFGLQINSAAPMHLLKSLYRTTSWNNLSSNSAAIHLLKTNPTRIIWYEFSKNPAAMYFFKSNPGYGYIEWGTLSSNPDAIHLLEANQDKINWHMLSNNPAAMCLLEANPDKIKWKNLSSNPSAIHLLEANPDKIDWLWLSVNPAAMHLLKANQNNNVHWKCSFSNPSIFEIKGYHYDRIRTRPITSVYPELLRLVLQPYGYGGPYEKAPR